ncbi:Tetratricopeptide repeat protein [Pseudomonas sp. IT-194MI4]|uniref:tetratricopeptide repeat protein n=1 Tax=Pseudomonas sp. IT-194MI4 TaxID=3026443 RepID=UPI0039E03C7E
MTTSTDVFAKRKQGDIDEAYRMALELMGASQVDNWDRKAFCWCLIDLIKRDAKNGNQENLPHYRRQLESIEVDSSDDVLAKGIRNALSLCNPHGQQISQAKTLSKDGRHAEAAAVYRKVWADGATDKETQTSFGWELYKHSKELMAANSVNLGAVKRNLHDYLKLDVEKPSLLHACFLQLATKLAGQDKFSMLVFSRLWELEYLRPEDFERYHAEDGKEYPSLAERVIQQAGKEAAASDNVQDLDYIVPHINAAIERYPDNIWLKLDKAKVLMSLGRNDEALTFGLQVAKAKASDYWAWGLLGDIVSRTDWQAALGCYCKALSCRADDKFTGKIRLKVAQRMLECNDWAAAKREIETVMHSKENEGHKIPEAVADLASQPWFAGTQANASNRDYYKAHASTAEALLFSDLPWLEANAGEKFTVPGKEDKPKRTIFLKTSSVPTEAVIPESKLECKKLAPGDAVRVKGEFDDNQRFKIFVLENRNSESLWDVFSEKIGVVDHVNKDKHVLHFIIDREIDGVIPIPELSDSFVEGDAIEVRLSRYLSKHGPAYRVHLARATDKKPSELVRKVFSEEVRVSNGMGFTETDIFVSPPLVAERQIEGGQKISGTAVMSYNKKRSCWGWKAVSIDEE